MTSGLWPRIQVGSAAAVSAGVRICERRSRLLGLDAPVVTKSELTGSLGVYAEKLAAERELFGQLDITQLEELAAESEALVAKAKAMLSANARALTAVSPSPADFPPSRLASVPSSLPDVEVTDVTRGNAVASGDLQALVGGSMVLVQGNGMTSELTTAPRTPVDGGDSTAEPAETPTTTSIE
jgi:hypothetical protein